MDLLASLTEARLHDSVERLSPRTDRHRGIVTQPEPQDLRVDVGRRLERAARDAFHNLSLGDVLDEDREVAHLPGRRSYPLGDLRLHEQDGEARWPVSFEERVE